MCEMTELAAVLLQLVRECKEVLKGGLLMKQYYQFMLHKVLDGQEKADCNIDAFEEDLHKMLMVRTACAYVCVRVRVRVGGGVSNLRAQWPPNRIAVCFCFIEPSACSRVCDTWDALGTSHSSGNTELSTETLSLVTAEHR